MTAQAPTPRRPSAADAGRGMGAGAFIDPGDGRGGGLMIRTTAKGKQAFSQPSHPSFSMCDWASHQGERWCPIPAYSVCSALTHPIVISPPPDCV